MRYPWGNYHQAFVPDVNAGAFAYQRTSVSRTILERSGALPARDDLDSAIRRSVIDTADDLRRALASRERFSA